MIEQDKTPFCRSVVPHFPNRVLESMSHFRSSVQLLFWIKHNALSIRQGLKMRTVVKNDQRSSL